MNAETRRPYESAVRTAKANATRARIAQAARELFTEQGWADTTVTGVARRAGVSVPTVYAAYGSKSDLAIALIDAADLAADPQRIVAELEAAAGDPEGQIRAGVAFDVRLFDTSGDLLALLRDAAASHPEIAEAVRQGPSRGDAARRAIMAEWPAERLRAGLTAEEASDRYAAICTLDGFRELRQRGWSVERIEQWWVEVLLRELLG